MVAQRQDSLQMDETVIESATIADCGERESGVGWFWLLQ